MRFSEPVRLPARRGELRVLEGAVWLTRRGDPADHRLQAGERLQVAVGDAVVLESWQRGGTALIDWRPAGPWAAVQRLLRHVTGRALGRSAGAAAALAGWLRRAETGVAAGAGGSGGA